MGDLDIGDVCCFGEADDGGGGDLETPVPVPDGFGDEALDDWFAAVCDVAA